MVKITAYAAYRAAIQKFSRKTLKFCVRQTTVEVKNLHRKSPVPSRARYPMYIDRLLDIPVSFYHKEKIM